METPCRKICLYDWNTKMCEGCGRTREEVASWVQLTDDQRRAIMADLPGRLAAAYPGRDAD